MSELLQWVHMTAAAVVLAEGLNKLERCDVLAPGLSRRLRVAEVMKALAWGLLVLGAAGALAPLVFSLFAVGADGAPWLRAALRMENPTMAEVLVLAGFAVLIVRTRVKEG